MTYTIHRLGNFDVYVADDTHCVHHAVDRTANMYNCKTLYPYVASKYGGYDNAVGVLTLAQARGRFKRGTLVFR